MSLPPKQIQELKVFVTALKSHPEVIWSPELGFFRDWLLSMNATLPPEPRKPEAARSHDDHSHSHAHGHSHEDHSSHGHSHDEHAHTHGHSHEDHGHSHDDHGHSHAHDGHHMDVEEEEMKLEMEPDDSLWEADTDSTHYSLGDINKHASDAEQAEAMELLNQGRSEHKGNQNYEEALKLFTEAIEKNPRSGPILAARADCFLSMKKPNACIRDCDRALQINSDNARALKLRGKAKRYLGRYVDAYVDMSQGQKIDWDEATDEVAKSIKGRVDKIHEFETKQRLKKESAELEERKRRAAEAKRAQEEARARSESMDEEEGMPGFGGLPPEIQAALSDPEVMGALRDPETMKQVQELMKNPSKLAEVQRSNPKLASLMAKLAPLAPLMNMMGGMGGMPGGMPGMGGMGGMPGFGGAPQPDDDLD